MKQDMIVVLDLGSTQNTYIAREIRALGVYSEIYPHDITRAQLDALSNVRGIVVNGGPNHIVDGKEIEGHIIPFEKGKTEYHVTAVMG